jgi:hypothetical protein
MAVATRFGKYLCLQLRILGDRVEAEAIKTVRDHTSSWRKMRCGYEETNGPPAATPRAPPTGDPALCGRLPTPPSVKQTCTTSRSEYEQPADGSDSRICDRRDHARTEVDAELGQQPAADERADYSDNEIAQQSEAGALHDLTTQSRAADWAPVQGAVDRLGFDLGDSTSETGRRCRTGIGR